jgi:hypothetical protein
MSDSFCARQRARSSIFMVSESLFPIRSHRGLEMNSLKVSLRVLVSRVHCLGLQIGRFSSYFDRGDMVENLVLVPISSVPISRGHTVSWPVL